MQKTRYSEQPEPVLVEAIKGYVHITVAVNITQVESDPPAWEADTNRFWVPAGELDLDAVRQNPAAYLHRATHLSDARAEAKAKAQMAVDSLRNGCPVVPCKFPRVYQKATFYMCPWSIIIKAENP